MDNEIYQPLDVSKKEIRLLTLQGSASSGDAIVGTISSVSLNDELSYDALSWCWGDVLDRTTLQLNGTEVQCPKNLDVALRYLRDATKPTTWWIDALCIKQDDLEEKTTQIPLMRDIYGQAEVVRIWLGEAADNSDEAIELLNRLLAGGNIWDKVDGKYLSKEQYEQIVALSQRPWWNRTWVAQEFVLARRAVFYCGRACFDAAGIHNWTSRVISEARKAKDELWLHLIKENVDTDTIMGAISKFIIHIDVAQMRTGSFLGSFYAVNILNQISRFQATDPRDKVFGALGLLDRYYTDVLKTIPNWYIKPTELIYATTTFLMLRSLRNLYPLCFIPKRTQSDMDSLSKWLFEIERDNPSANSKEMMPTLPSWSIDFSKDSRKRGSLNAWFDCTPKLEFVPGKSLKWDHPFLIVRSIQFDEIVACHPVYTELKDVGKGWGRLNIMRQFHSRWRMFFGIPHDVHTACQAYIGGGSLEDAYWRTIVGDMCENEEFNMLRMTSPLIKSYVKWFRQKNEKPIDYPSDWPDSGHGPADIYSQSLLCWLQVKSQYNSNAHLFVTRRGYIGLSVGRSAIAVGDQIYLLAHGDTPFVLRSCNHPTKEAFTVVCECYVDGIMDGQAFKPVPLPPTKKGRQNELRRKVFGGSAPDPVLPLAEWKDVTLI